MKKQDSKSFARGDRIAAKVQTLVAEILRDQHTELSITLTGAESSGGLQFVKLFYQARAETTPRYQEKALIRPEVQKKLDEIKPQIRRELAARIDQKYTPDIRFVYDDSLDKSERIEKLLEALK